MADFLWYWFKGLNYLGNLTETQEKIKPRIRSQLVSTAHADVEEMCRHGDVVIAAVRSQEKRYHQLCSHLDYANTLTISLPNQQYLQSADNLQSNFSQNNNIVYSLKNKCNFVLLLAGTIVTWSLCINHYASWFRFFTISMHMKVNFHVHWNCEKSDWDAV